MPTGRGRALRYCLLAATFLLFGVAVLMTRLTTMPACFADDRTSGWRDFQDVIDEGQADRFLTDWTHAESLFPSTAAGNMGAMGQGAMRADEPQDLGGVEIIIRTLYNPEAKRHVNETHLAFPETLQAMLDSKGSKAGRGDMGIPAFPDGSKIILTAWWPAAPDARTPIPVWDPENNPVLDEGNHYLTWKRVLAIEPRLGLHRDDETLSFGGAPVANAGTVTFGQFHHVQVDNVLAASLMSDPRRRKAAVLALGRAMRGGDHLLLVAVNMMVKRQGRWHWRTFWWHDRPEWGAFAQGRPSGLPRPWSNYLMDVAADPVDQPAADPARSVTFNPWLEARFSVSSHGGGLASNCVACHRRATFPPVSFLPINTLVPDKKNDPAFASDRLSTDFVWGIGRNASHGGAVSEP